MMISKRVLAPLLMVGALFAGMLLLQTTEWNWIGYTRAPCYPYECYCEAVTFGPIEQVSNTYSNLPFLLVALLIVFSSPPRVAVGAPLMLSHGALRWLYAAAVFVMGFGSLFYHGSLILIGKFSDWFGMFLFASFMLVYTVARHTGNYSLGSFLGRYFVLNVLLVVAILVLESRIRSVVFAVIVITASAFGVWTNITRPTASVTSQKYAWLAGLLIGVAFSVWLLDSFSIWCSPRSLLQGHALWHVLAAGSCGFLYLYFQSERLLAVERDRKSYGSHSAAEVMCEFV